MLKLAVGLCVTLVVTTGCGDKLEKCSAEHAEKVLVQVTREVCGNYTATETLEKSEKIKKKIISETRRQLARE